MNPKNPLYQKCLAYLESLPNIKVNLQEDTYVNSEVLADGQLTLNTSQGTVSYVCEIKTEITSQEIEQIVEYFAHLASRLEREQRPLLVTRHLSKLVSDRLIQKNIEFIDVAGNIYLNSPGIYILVREQFKKNSEDKNLGITPADLQVIYALLKQHKIILLCNNCEQNIAALVGVTQKTVKTTLKKLEKLNYVKRKQRGYEIINYVKLFERWELGYSERLRGKLLIGTFTPIGKRDFSEVEAEITKLATNHEYLIGGELAASIMTQYLRPVGATLHINKNVEYRQIAVNLKLKPDSEGNIVLLQNFGDDNCLQDTFGEQKKNLVNPLLVHAELVRSNDSRLKETAQIIYKKYIEEIAQQHDWYAGKTSFERFNNNN